MNDLLIEQLAKKPFDPVANAKLALAYEKQGQISAAITFYLRTAEFGRVTQPALTYASLIKLSQCFISLGDRAHTVMNSLLQAVSFDPSRREAYFFLAQIAEREKEWQQCMTWTSIGLAQKEQEPLPMDVGYKNYGLLFERAVSAYWLGKRDMSLELFKHLKTLKLAPEYRASVEDNHTRLLAELTTAKLAGA